MCYDKTPTADVNDLIIVDELREEVEIQLHLNQAIETNFAALQIEEDADPLDDGIIQHISPRPIVHNEPGQFDEINPQYFADDYDTIPSFLHQEL